MHRVSGAPTLGHLLRAEISVLQMFGILVGLPRMIPSQVLITGLAVCTHVL